MVDTMKYYIEAKEVIDTDSNLLLPSRLSSRHLDDLIKYIQREDAIRQVLKLLFDRKRDNDQDMMSGERAQLKLELPLKFDQLYEPIKKLNHLSEQLVSGTISIVSGFCQCHRAKCW